MSSSGHQRPHRRHLPQPLAGHVQWEGGGFEPALSRVQTLSLWLEKPTADILKISPATGRKVWPRRSKRYRGDFGTWPLHRLNVLSHDRVPSPPLALGPDGLTDDIERSSRCGGSRARLLRRMLACQTTKNHNTVPGTQVRTRGVGYARRPPRKRRHRPYLARLSGESQHWPTAVIVRADPQGARVAWFHNLSFHARGRWCSAHSEEGMYDRSRRRRWFFPTPDDVNTCCHRSGSSTTTAADADPFQARLDRDAAKRSELATSPFVTVR